MPTEDKKQPGITTQALITLIEGSKTVQEMPEATKKRLLQTAKDPSSPGAIKLYDALTEEKRQMDNIANNYDRMMKEIVHDFEVGVIETTVDLKKKLKK